MSEEVVDGDRHCYATPMRRQDLSTDGAFRGQAPPPVPLDGPKGVEDDKETAKQRLQHLIRNFAHEAVGPGIGIEAQCATLASAPIAAQDGTLEAMLRMDRRLSRVEIWPLGTSEGTLQGSSPAESTSVFFLASSTEVQAFLTSLERSDYFGVYYLLRDSTDAVRADKGCVLAAVKKNGWALEHAASGLKADEEVVLAAATARGREPLFKLPLQQVSTIVKRTISDDDIAEAGSSPSRFRNLRATSTLVITRQPGVHGQQPELRVTFDNSIARDRAYTCFRIFQMSVDQTSHEVANSNHAEGEADTRESREDGGASADTIAQP